MGCGSPKGGSKDEMTSIDRSVDPSQPDLASPTSIQVYYHLNCTVSTLQLQSGAGDFNSLPAKCK